MKKINSILAAIAAMMVLTSCAPYKNNGNTVIKEEVVREIETIREVIKEVPVEQVLQVSIGEVIERVYQPGQYMKTLVDGDETVKVIMSVNDYGAISGLYIDRFTNNNDYLYDEETDKLYVYVHGLEDVIPNTYRLVKFGDPLPTIKSTITSDDYVVGYPLDDEIIKNFVKVDAVDSRRIKDSSEESWASDMDKLAEMIIKNQTVYTLPLYTDTVEIYVEGIESHITEEIDMIKEIMDQDARLKKEELVKSTSKPTYGLYEPGAYISHSDPIYDGKGVSFITSYVVVDPFGKLDAVSLDKLVQIDGFASSLDTAEKNDKKLTAEQKSTLNELGLIEEATLRNNGIDAFKYKDQDGKVSSNISYDYSEGQYLDPANFNNIPSVTAEANNIVYVLDKAFEQANLKSNLKPGIYYYLDGAGNIVTVNVGYQATEEINTFTRSGDPIQYEEGDQIKTEHVQYLFGKYVPAISSVSIDVLYSQDDAYMTVGNEKVQLFVYEKESHIYFLDDSTETVLIYKKGDNYYYAMTDDTLVDVNAHEKVDFTRDEEKSIEKINSLLTKQILGEEYEDAEDYGDLSWSEQIGIYTDALMGSQTPYIFNMDEDGENTNSFEGLQLDVDVYNQLIIDTVALNKSNNNTASNVAEVTIGTGGYLLGDGTYYGKSNIVSEDGGLYIASMTVVDNQISTLMLDEVVRTPQGLKLKSDSEQENSYYQYYLTQANTDVSKLLTDYDYQLTTELAEENTFYSSASYLYPWNGALEEMLLEALRARVTQTMEDIDSYIVEKLDEEYVVTNRENIGGIELDFTELVKIATVGTETYVVDLSFDSSSEIDVATDDYKVMLTSDQMELSDRSKANLEYKVEFDDYEELYNNESVILRNNVQFKRDILGYSLDNETNINSLFGGKYTSLLSGETLRPSLLPKAQEMDNLLGEGDVSNELGFTFTSIKDVRLEFANFAGATSISYNEAGMTASLSNFEFKWDDKIYNVNYSGNLNSMSESNFGGSVSDLSDAKKALEGYIFKKVAFKDFKAIYTGSDASSYGQFNIVMYYDSSNADPSTYNIYNKGEAELEFEVIVHSEESASKNSQRKVNQESIVKYVAGETPIKIANDESIGIKGIGVTWTLTEDFESMLTGDPIKDAAILDSLKFITDKNGFVDENGENFTETYNGSGYLKIQQAYTMQYRVRLTASYTGLPSNTNYVLDLIVLPVSSEDAKEHIAEVLESEARRIFGLYENLEYYGSVNGDSDLIVPFDKKAFTTDSYLGQPSGLASSQATIVIDGKVLQTNFDWTYESGVNIPQIMTFEQALLNDVQFDKPEVGKSVTTGLVGTVSYTMKINNEYVNDNVKIHFPINLHNNGRVLPLVDFKVTAQSTALIPSSTAGSLEYTFVTIDNPDDAISLDSDGKMKINNDGTARVSVSGKLRGYSTTVKEYIVDVVGGNPTLRQ